VVSKRGKSGEPSKGGGALRRKVTATHRGSKVGNQIWAISAKMQPNCEQELGMHNEDSTLGKESRNLRIGNKFGNQARTPMQRNAHLEHTLGTHGGKQGRNIHSESA
jgi:hypothetical protein